MTTYKCNDCGNVFTEDELLVHEEYVPYGDTAVRNDSLGTALCPYCKGEDIEEAAKCPVCGEWHTWTSEYIDYCRECEEKTERILGEIKRATLNLADSMAVEKGEGNLVLIKGLMAAVRGEICI